MCGIAGFLYRDPERTGPIGATILGLLDVLGSRGTDGTGVALYGAPDGRGMLLRVWLGETAHSSARAVDVAERLRAVALVEGTDVRDDYATIAVRPPHGEAASQGAWMAALIEAAEAGDAGAVFSAGHTLQITKAVGVAAPLGARYGLSAFEGTHGIGHTRLATESKVDVAHCHPFWARPYPDIAVVHNGQITNYRKLRRLMEMRGIRFATGNDSEIIALYLAERLGRGESLDEALRASIADLDGTFTYLVSTAQGIGMAKDNFATKPLVVAECDEWVAIASEEGALSAVFDGPLSIYQPGAGEAQVWMR